MGHRGGGICWDELWRVEGVIRRAAGGMMHHTCTSTGQPRLVCRGLIVLSDRQH